MPIAPALCPLTASLSPFDPGSKCSLLGDPVNFKSGRMSHTVDAKAVLCDNEFSFSLRWGPFYEWCSQVGGELVP